MTQVYHNPAHDFALAIKRANKRSFIKQEGRYKVVGFHSVKHKENMLRVKAENEALGIKPVGRRSKSQKMLKALSVSKKKVSLARLNLPE